MMRAAIEAATAAFALSALSVVAFYTAVLSVHPSDALANAITLGLIAFTTVFAAVSVMVSVRLSRKSLVLGPWRGAVIAVGAVVVVVASAHACFTFGSGGLMYSLLGQVCYACLVGGAPAAIAGALLGRSIERRVFAQTKKTPRMR